MRLKFIKQEDFVNYKKASMFLGTCFCDFKCCHEAGFPTSLCQNEPWSKEPIKQYDDIWILNEFDSNPFVDAIVLGGMEPLKQFDELIDFLNCRREHKSEKVNNADVVIYTGYYPNEIKAELLALREFPNIIMKYGRFIPNIEGRFDPILGVNLASNNQYAEKLDTINWSAEEWLSR